MHEIPILFTGPYVPSLFLTNEGSLFSTHRAKFASVCSKIDFGFINPLDFEDEH